MKKLFQNQAVRYIFFGGCSTMVNLCSYYVLRNLLGMDITAANTAAILAAILFAYVVNKLFVFEHHTASLGELLREAGSFIGMRLGTMVVEVLGVVLLNGIWGMNDMIAKIAIQFVILVLNYLISRFVVFKDNDGAQEQTILIEEKKRGRRFFMAAFCLSALVTGIGFACLEIWPFGDKTVLIIDSLHQYLPFYTDLHEKLTESQSLLFSFSGGLGYNFWSTYAYYMASPLNFLLAFIPKENVCDFMDLMILFKIAAAGGFFSWYLHQRDKTRQYQPVIFGVMFALSNFMIGYYFNLMWLDSIAVLPLVMYGIEQITEGRNGKLFGLALFYALWCNYYIGFMLCIFSCLYFLVRWIAQEKITWRGVYTSCLKFGWYALLAGGMAALVLVPAFMGLSSSESMQGNSFPTTIKFYENLAQLLENHMAFLEPVNISNSQVGLNIYCGMASVLLAVLYLFDRRIRIRERLAHYGLCALFLLSFALNILNYIWHGFHIQNGLPNRFAFLYIAIVLVMAYDALGHLKNFCFVKLFLSWALPAAFLVWRYLQPEQEIEAHLFYISFGLLLLYFGILLIGRYFAAERSRIFAGVFSLVILAEAAANAIYGISCNGNVTRSIYLNDQKSYQTLMSRQEDESFFRSEVDRQRMRNVTMYAGGYSMIMFNSTMQDSVIDFCDRIGVEARTNKNGYLGVTKLMNDVLGIKYVASPNKDASTLYQLVRIDEDGELALYKNENALSIGFMVKDSIRDWDIEAGEPLQVQNSFVQLATGLEPIYVLDRYIDMENGQNYGILVPENKQVYLCLDTRVKEIQLNTPEYSKTYTDYTDHLYVINRADGEELADFTVTLKDNQTTVQAEVYTCANEAYQKVVDKLSESQMTDVQVDGNVLTGQVEAKEAGTLLLTIPYDEGWEVQADGQNAEVFRVGEALMGIHLEAGTHTITMKYTPPGLWLGTGLTLLCVLLFFFSGMVEKRLNTWAKPKYTENEQETEYTQPETEILTQEADWEYKNRTLVEQECLHHGEKIAEGVELRLEKQNLVKRLREAAGETCILENEPMKNHTTFRIGGPADFYAVPDTIEKAAAVVRICREQNYPFYVIGNGSNLLVADEGYRGLILQIYRNLSAITVEGDEITVQAGAMLSVIAKRALEHSLTGFEFASGIPGTIGGAAVMNAGAYGGEMKDVLTEVTVLTRENEIRTVPAEELDLGYRHSVIPQNGWIVLGAKLRLQKGEEAQIRARMEELKEQRVTKQPLEYPSAGSTFKRPEGYFAGKLIMDAGLRGYTVGGAQVAEKHCGFVINRENATAQDVRQLMNDVSDKVNEQFGVTLEPEVKMLGF